jgi:hypothetical protein
VGNGPNRLSESAVSWQEVLDQLARFAHRKPKCNGDKPLPLLFEEIALSLERTGRGNVGDLKKHLAFSLRNFAPNSVHNRIMGLGLQHVLTTNYDYSLELAEGRQVLAGVSPAALIHEARFSLFRFRESLKTRVWHVHGEAGYPRSILLGYDHYGAYLGRLHGYLTGTNADGHASPFIGGVEEFENGTRPYSWVDVFLRNDVHIVGLTLDFAEIDLWWLLIFKDRLRHKNSSYKGRPRVGRTVFYDFQRTALTPGDTARLSLLEGLGVQVVSYLIEGESSYVKAFHRVLTDLRPARNGRA